MKLPPILTSPPPSTAWSIDGETVAAVRRDRRGAVTGASQEVPAGTFEVGPVGLQSVDPGRLEPVVRSVQERLSGPSRAAVVLPSGWLRSHLLDFDQLPRKRGEVEDVLRWRLKRLLPVPPTELRIAWSQTATGESTRRLVTAVGYRKAMDTLEEVLVSAGVQPGLITSRLLAVASGEGAGVGARLVVQGEPGFVSLLLVERDVPRLLRTKPVESGMGAAAVDRELGLALHFIRDALGVAGVIDVMVSAHEPDLEAVVAGFVGRHGDDLRQVPAGALDGLDPDLLERVGEARLLPLQVVTGGAP